MKRVLCAVAVLGLAILVGATVGAVTAFVWGFFWLVSVPSWGIEASSLAGAARIAAIGAAIGALAGALVAAVSWAAASAALLLVNLRRPSRAVRMGAVALGAAVGGGMVFWYFGMQPGWMLNPGLFTMMTVLPAGLAVVALLTADQLGPHAGLQPARVK